jgi:dihydrofolate reductase
MRKVVLSLGLSLDGYIAREDGSFDFLYPIEPDLDWAAFHGRFDWWLLGRKTVEDVIKAEGKFSTMGLRTLVFSQTLEPGERDGVEYTRESPREAVDRLRQTPGKDLWLGGGGELVRSFLEADLVDELEFGYVPVLIGEGRRLFPPRYPETRWKLAEHRAYPKTGMMQVRYVRA